MTTERPSPIRIDHRTLSATLPPDQMRSEFALATFLSRQTTPAITQVDRGREAAGLVQTFIKRVSEIQGQDQRGNGRVFAHPPQEAGSKVPGLESIDARHSPL